MEIKNILKTGYHVIVVTVALIEAFELGKNLAKKTSTFWLISLRALLRS